MGGRLSRDGRGVWAGSALIAAVYLLHDTIDTPDLQEDFRIRALAAAVFTGPLAFGTLAVARLGAPYIYDALVSSALALLLHIGTGVVAVEPSPSDPSVRDGTCAGDSADCRYFCRSGRGTVPWVALKITFANAAAPDHVLWSVLGILGVGGTLLVPALGWLYSVFKLRDESSAS